MVFKNKKLYIYVSLFALLFVKHVDCQNKVIINYNSWFDNREYFNEYAQHQTLFGHQALGLWRYKHENFEFNAGGLINQDFGSSIDEVQVLPTIYAIYTSGNIKVGTGLYPTTVYTDFYSDFQLDDSIRYSSPLSSGLFINYEKGEVKQTGWVDWKGKKAVGRKEEIIIGIAGETPIIKNIYLTEALKIHHIAKSEDADSVEYIRDNLSGELNLQYKTHKELFFILGSVGLAGSMDRERDDNVWHNALGLLLKAHVGYRFAGLGCEYYTGGRHEVVTGSDLYKAKNYIRFDLMAYPLGMAKKDNLYLQFSVHLVEGLVDYSQLLTLRHKFEL